MDINLKINPGESIRAFYLFFVMVGVQIGVGALGAPRFIFEKAHYDAWISVLIAYLFMLFVASIMFIILSRYDNADIFGIQTHLFGKLVGKLLGTAYIIFITMELLSLLINYIEIVQVFLFPTIPSFFMAAIMLTLVVYSVLGGVRVIVGVVFIFTLLSPWILILLFDPISRMEFTHFLPMFNSSITELLKGAKTTSYTFLGMEILLLIFPFVDRKEKAKLPTYLGLSASALFVLITTIISIGYFSPNDFDLIHWPVLTLFKSVSFSFMERFDYFIIAEWMMVTVPVAILLMWSIVHGTERLFKVPQKKSLYVFSAILLILCTFINTTIKIETFSDFVAKCGFWIVYIYPIILLPLVLFKTRRKGSKDVHNE